MAKNKKRTDLRDFFSLAEGRRDRWSLLNDRARTWTQVRGRVAEKVKGEAAGLLSEITPLEGFYAYPGSRILGILKERLTAEDAEGFAHLTQKILTALLSESFRREPAAWDTDEEAETAAGDRLEAYFGKMDAHRPYFEVLSVTPSPPGNWEKNRQEVRRLRRPEDPFIYELVQAGNFEDAVAAIVVNANLQAVAIYDGFGYRSPLDMPLLKEQLARHLKIDLNEVAPRHLGLTLAQVIKHLRPEIDIYLMADRDVEELAGSEETTAIRRIFYDLEELLEIHLSILEGINQRYDTPYFSNLKRYSQRPVGTFHALPVARGKSIFKSNWIRDMGHFYGINLFLAESSATTGGLDSLLEPTGNIKEAQDKAARAFGAKKAFFATNGTSTSNKIVVQALTSPGDIVLVDRNCHKSHHYGCILAGAQPLYLEAYPLTEYSMYGAVPLRTIKKALLDLQAEGKLDRARMVDLTNCTFDGHMYNPRRVMEECLAIKPDLVFLWDEAWFGFARFSLFHRPRTAMAAAAALEARYRDPAYRQEYEAFKSKFGSFDPTDPGFAGPAPVARPGPGAHPGLSHPFHPQVHVGPASGFHDPGLRSGFSPGGRGLPRGLFHPHFDLAQSADHRLSGRGPAADGAGRLRPGHEGQRTGLRYPAGGQQPPPAVQIFPHTLQRRNGPPGITGLRHRRLRSARFRLDRCAGGLAGGRVRPGPHPDDPGLRHGRVRRHGL